MDLESVKLKLTAHRASGSRKIPEEIWKDVVQLSQKQGIGTVGKKLSLDTARIRVWASRFGVDIPKAVRKKSTEKHILKISEVKIENPGMPRASQNGKKVLELSSGNGICLSFFESGTDIQLEKILRLVKEAL